MHHLFHKSRIPPRFNRILQWFPATISGCFCVCDSEESVNLWGVAAAERLNADTDVTPNFHRVYDMLDVYALLHCTVLHSTAIDKDEWVCMEKEGCVAYAALRDGEYRMLQVQVVEMIACI